MGSGETSNSMSTDYTRPTSAKLLYYTQLGLHFSTDTVFVSLISYKQKHMRPDVVKFSDTLFLLMRDQS